MAQAQTFSLDHKRHSGSAETFVHHSTYGMGLPPVRLVTIERFQSDDESIPNCTTFYHGYYSGNSESQERIDNHPVYNSPTLNMDSLWLRTHDLRIQFIGFEGYYTDEDIEVRAKRLKEELKLKLLEKPEPKSCTKEGNMGILFLGLMLCTLIANGLRQAGMLPLATEEQTD